MIYFIVNPSSSSQQGILVWKKTEAYLKEQKISYKLHMLKGPGDAAKTAEKLSAMTQPCTVVLVGGDGTINEFLSGLTRRSHISFYVIPIGSGNDFVRGMKLPSDPAVCIPLITGRNTLLPVDTGIVTDGTHLAPFGVSSGIGYDAAACYAASTSPLKPALNRIHLGKLVYLVCALKMLLSIRRFDIRIRIDGQEPVHYTQAYFAAAMNVPYEGGGIPFCPEADPADGMLDLIVAEGLNRLEVLTTLVKALKGKHTGCKGIHLFRCRTAEVECDTDQCVHMDGEHFGFSKKITWSLHEEKLQVITDR